MGCMTWQDYQNKGDRKCGETMGRGLEDCVLCYEEISRQEGIQTGLASSTEPGDRGTSYMGLLWQVNAAHCKSFTSCCSLRLTLCLELVLHMAVD